MPPQVSKSKVPQAAANDPERGCGFNYENSTFDPNMWLMAMVIVRKKRHEEIDGTLTGNPKQVPVSVGGCIPAHYLIFLPGVVRCSHY